MDSIHKTRQLESGSTRNAAINTWHAIHSLGLANDNTQHHDNNMNYGYSAVYWCSILMCVYNALCVSGAKGHRFKGWKL